MTKTFITIISMQGDDLQKLMYAPQGFTLQNNVKSSFPIVPCISNEIAVSGKKDDIFVIALCADDDEDAKYNYENIFLKELEAIHIHKSQVKCVKCKESPNTREDIKVLFEIIDLIPEDSVICADITHGTKLMSVYALYSCIYAERLKDVEVEHIVYGELPWKHDEAQVDEAKLHDITALKDLGNAIDGLQALEIDDIRSALLHLTGI